MFHSKQQRCQGSTNAKPSVPFWIENQQNIYVKKPSHLYTRAISRNPFQFFFKFSKHGPQGVGSKPRAFARIGAFSPKITGGVVFEASNVNCMLARDSSWLIQKFSFGLVTNFENSCKTCRERGKRRVKLDLLCFKKML